MSGEQLDQIECICKRRGWSYEDYVYESLWALHNGKTVDDEDFNPADWRKKM